MCRIPPKRADKVAKPSAAGVFYFRAWGGGGRGLPATARSAAAAAAAAWRPLCADGAGAARQLEGRCARRAVRPWALHFAWCWEVASQTGNWEDKGAKNKVG